MLEGYRVNFSSALECIFQKSQMSISPKIDENMNFGQKMSKISILVKTSRKLAFYFKNVENVDFRQKSLGLLTSVYAIFVRIAHSTK